MITQEQLKKLIHYDPDVGCVTWLPRLGNKSFNTRFSGRVASCPYETKDGKSYTQITILGENYKTHRVIWLYMMGGWPDQIDHINGDGTDNRWCNLRNVSNLENGRNQRLSNNNTSGVSGVYWCNHASKWRSTIMVSGKTIHLSRFNTWWDAVCARKSAEYRYGFHRNHGQIRPL